MMITRHITRFGLTIFGIAALIGTLGCVPQPEALPAEPPAPEPELAPPPPEPMSAILDRVRVAPEDSTAPYDRDDWSHWETGHGWPYPENCDTRDIVLLETGGKHPDNGSGADPDTCTVRSGQWLSLYDMRQVRDPDQLEIDHVVPLAEAARSGARNWDEQKRARFANDRAALAAVSITTNREKSDQDPARWTPPARLAWCPYARMYTDAKARYGLTVDQAEHDALADMLATCEEEPPPSKEKAQ